MMQGLDYGKGARHKSDEAYEKCSKKMIVLSLHI